MPEVTHWMPDLDASKATVGICGQAGWVTLHQTGVTCKACLQVGGVTLFNEGGK